MNSLKTIYSRLTTMQPSIDSLASIGINIKNSNGDMKSATEIISELQSKWSSLSAETQQNTAVTLAGRFQLSRFIALMQGQQISIDATATSLNSYNSAVSENSEYLKSLEARINRMKNAFTELSLAMGDALLTDSIIAITTGLGEIAKVGSSLTHTFGALPTVVGAVSIAVIMLSQNFRTALVAAIEYSVGLKGLTVSAGATKIALRGLASATVVGVAFVALGFMVEKLIGSFGDMAQSSNSVDDAFVENKKEAINLANKYGDLKKIVDDNTKSDIEIKNAKAELSVVIGKIGDKIPSLVTKWDEHGRAIGINIDQLVKFKAEYADAIRIVEQDKINKLTEKKSELEKKKADAKGNIKNDNPYDFERFGFVAKKVITNGSVDWMNLPKQYKKENAENMLKYGKEIDDIDAQLKQSQQTLDFVNGKSTNTDDKKPKSSGTNTRTKTAEEIEEEYKSRKESFDSRMGAFNHQVNIEAKGYATAKEQLTKLKGIRAEFKDLNSEDLYGIDEAIHRTNSGIKVKPKNIPSGSTKPDKGKTKEDIAKEARDQRKKDFDDALSKHRYLVEMQDWSADQQIAGLHRISKNNKVHLKEEVADQRSLNVEVKKLTEDKVKTAEEKNNESFEASKSWIEKRKYFNQLSLQEEYAAWDRVQKKYKKDSEQWIDAEKEKYRVKKEITDKLIDKAKELSEKEKDLNKDILDKQKEIKDQVSSLVDEISDIYKDAYESQKKGELQAIENKLKLLDKELKKYEEIYDARMKLIDDESASEDYKRKLLKLQDEQIDIQKDLNTATLNDDISNKKRREELEKALAEKTNEINEYKHEHEVDLRKKSLENDLEIKKKEAEAEKGRLDQSKEDTEKYWDDQINNDKKFAQIRQEVMSGVFTTVLTDFATFKTSIGSNSALIGETLSTNVTDKISKMETQITESSALIKTAFEEIGTKLETTFLKTLQDLIAELNKLDGLKTDNLNQQLQNTAKILEQIALSSKVWKDLSLDGKQQEHDKVVKLLGALDQANGTTTKFNEGTGTYTTSKDGAVLSSGTATEVAKVIADSKSLNLGNNGIDYNTATTEQKKKMQEDAARLKTDASYAQSEIDRANAVISDRKNKNLDTSAQEAYLKKLESRHIGGEVEKGSSSVSSALHEAFNLNKNEKVMKLLNSEVVINPANFKPRNFLQDILSSVKMPNFSGISPAMAGGAGNNFNLTLNIENMNGTKNEANNFANIMVSELNRMGLKI